MTDKDIQRFEAKYTVSPETGCWEWTATKSRGYGYFSYGKGMVLAHRFAYEAFVGHIPKGLHLDHLCRVKHCVNPEHLEPVTARENVLRGESIPSRNSKKTHCFRGHPFTEENTATYIKNQRRCITCRRERVAELRRQRGMVTRDQWVAPRGVDAPLAKLTEDIVVSIRRSHAQGVAIRHLAKIYEVAPSTIRNVVRRITWKHVKDT